MAHELDLSNGQANMAFVGAVPWHGLGQQLTEGADVETWKKEAGLAWQIKVSGVVYNANSGDTDTENWLIMPDRRLFYRSDTKAALSVVSADFRIVQPGEVLEFYRDLVSTAGFQLETAGSLFGGRKFWALARCGKSARIVGQDEIKPYLLLASACDGSMATVAHFTSVRVVCNNTLRMSVGENGSKATLRVPHNATFDHEQAKKQLGIVGDIWENFLDSVKALAATKIHRDDAIDLVAAQLKAEWQDEVGNELARDGKMESSAALRRIIQLFDGAARGAQFKSANGTAWGLVNAVTEFYDHEAGSKKDKSRAFERAHLTDRANFKVRVTNELLKLAA